MSETEKFVGKIQLRPRLENETDKDYFERVTGCNWQKYDYDCNSPCIEGEDCKTCNSKDCWCSKILQIIKAVKE